MKIKIICTCLFSMIICGFTNSQIIPDFIVNDDQGYYDQSVPTISVDGQNNFVVTWSDLRNGSTAIYAQRYLHNGEALATNFKVSEAENIGNWGWPVVASDHAGNFVITWGDERNGDGDVYAQRYTSEGVALEGNIRVSNDTSGARQYDPYIAMDSAGNYIITWYDTRNWGYDIYARRYSSDGIPLSDNFQVNFPGSFGYHDGPEVAVGGDGTIIITWTDSRDGDKNIYAQRYSGDGLTLGDNFKVNTIDEGTQDSPSVSSDCNGNFVITWSMPLGDSGNIYAQRFSNEGLALGENFQVNNVSPGSNHWGPFVANDCNGDFVIVWTEIRSQDSSHIYAQRFSSDGSAIGENFKISPRGAGVHVDLRNERIYNTWINFSDSMDYDIWANVMDWNDPFGITDEELKSGIQVITVYPNPSSGALHLRYTKHETRNTNLELYSIQGIKLRTLMDQVQPPGEYDLSFNISDLPDGMYFVRMQLGEHAETVKIIKVGSRQ